MNQLPIPIPVQKPDWDGVMQTPRDEGPPAEKPMTFTLLILSASKQVNICIGLCSRVALAGEECPKNHIVKELSHGNHHLKIYQI